ELTDQSRSVMVMAVLKWRGLVAGVFMALVVAAIFFLTRSPSKHPGQVGRPRLPVGAGTPAIGVQGAHGVILASDGSLWSWGANADGWPVLGLGKITNQPSLRRIGNETNWVSIAVGEDHTLAIKSDG